MSEASRQVSEFSAAGTGSELVGYEPLKRHAGHIRGAGDIGGAPPDHPTVLMPGPVPTEQ